ncbi:DHH family phosphoesterase [Thalassotalea profundi]|uniref:Acetyltransferase n=1 Tax=Thalassotalea profundi TaxID=2036687 RepID=A0ABQ3IFK0_9GAMM|nr:DHH family phosphoesterase [Thalassotalea profundi]GHE80412.1 acetyltransferase [Thalassotalea profundi]
MHFDVFNGDADGIIALVQLRLAQPKESILVTGVKRDINLVEQVDVSTASSMTVLDISMEKNTEALNKVLAHNIPTFYVDHHRTGDIPVSEWLTTIINTDANTCTSLLINEHLNGQFAYWAIAAAFGDNMNLSATSLANKLGLSEEQQAQLKALGIYVNYNGYGATIEDLHYPPAELFKLLVQFENPFDLINDKHSVFTSLEKAYQEDMLKVKQAEILADETKCKVIVLPDEAWARRISGVLGNDLANQSPNKAHAVFTENADGSYRVSLRAPLSNKQGADTICVQFPTGGGRSAAAGINYLPAELVSKFIETVKLYY